MGMTATTAIQITKQFLQKTEDCNLKPPNAVTEGNSRVAITAREVEAIGRVIELAIAATYPSRGHR